MNQEFTRPFKPFGCFFLGCRFGRDRLSPLEAAEPVAPPRARTARRRGDAFAARATIQFRSGTSPISAGFPFLFQDSEDSGDCARALDLRPPGSSVQAQVARVTARAALPIRGTCDDKPLWIAGFILKL